MPNLPQVMARHRSVSPDCPFILNKSNNVPLIQSMNAGGGGGGNENLQVCAYNTENVSNIKSEKSATKNLLNPIFSQPPIVDLTDSPPGPQRETTVTSSNGSGAGSGSPRATGVPSTASEVNYTDDAAPAARGQPLDLVQGCIAQWNFQPHLHNATFKSACSLLPRSVKMTYEM